MAGLRWNHTAKSGIQTAMRHADRLVRCWLVFALLAGCGPTPPTAERGPTTVNVGGPTPPMAQRRPTTVNLGGQMVTDDYWWLRNKQDPAVLQYLSAENAYTTAVLKPTEALQQKLYDESMARLPEVNEGVPYRIGDWWYSVRDQDAQDYPVYLRRKGSPTTQPVVIADLNAMAKGHDYFDFASEEVSPDGNLMAFSTDITGNRQYVLQVKDLRSNASLKDQIPRVDSFTWMQDNRALYYTRQDDAKRAYRLYRHALGSPVERDDLVYEEKDVTFSISVDCTRDRKWIICESDSSTQTEVRVFPSDKPAAPILIEPRKADLEYYVDHRDGRFYIRVNDTGENFRIVSTPEDAPGREHWTELVAADPQVTLTDFDLFAHDLVLSERRNGLPQVAIAKLPDGPGDPARGGELKAREVAFSEPDFDVSMSENHVFDPPAIRIEYSSLTTPFQTIDVSLSDGKQMVLKQGFAGSDFDRSNYEERRLFATADDGTRIPISLVYRKNKAMGPNGHPCAPMLLGGYGSYGNASNADFSRDELSLLNRGMICAIAHVRGGGEYGRTWYDGGRMKNKMNTFTDFIACAKYLEENGWSTPKEMAIDGASAGGLLIGAVVERQPELFRAAVADVPWVDVLADMCDPSVPLTTLEYSEWGNPNIPDQRAYIASYDPYRNVRRQAYPDLLVLESFNDSQVQYWDATRWVAKLRWAKAQAGAAGESQLLFKMYMDAGHDGPSGQESALREEALVNAWLLTRLGVEGQ